MRSRGKILQAAWNLRVTSSKVSSNENALPLDALLSHNQPRKTYVQERLYSSKENWITGTKSVKNAIMLIDFFLKKNSIARNICSSRVFRIPFYSYECLLGSVQSAMISVLCFMARSQNEELFDAPRFKFAAWRIRKKLNQCEVQTTRGPFLESPENFSGPKSHS